MPTTHARRDFVRQSIKYFNEQDYPNKELIIIDGDDEGGKTVYGVVPVQDNIEYVYINLGGAELHLPLGAKRNLGCSLAKGQIICHWDDDDYYGPERLSRQVAPLLQNANHVTALKMSLLFNVQSGSLWVCSEQEHKQLFDHDVRAATLMYHASYWRNTPLKYPDLSRGEDVIFLGRLRSLGAHLMPLSDFTSYVCVRHGANTTDEMEYEKYSHWKQLPAEEYLPAPALAFYQSLRGVKIDD